MNTLSLMPEQDTFNVTDGPVTISSREQGSQSFFARIDRNAARAVSVGWTLDPYEYKELFDFYLANSAIPFLMALPLENAVPHTCMCKFDSFKLDSVSGQCYKVSGTISAVPYNA